jgi:hypothetical protein
VRVRNAHEFDAASAAAPAEPSTPSKARLVANDSAAAAAASPSSKAPAAAPVVTANPFRNVGK